MDKVGRNEPCPCSSGKKFKKCHGSSATEPARGLIGAPTKMPKRPRTARGSIEGSRRENSGGQGGTAHLVEFAVPKSTTVERHGSRLRVHYGHLRSENWKSN